MRTSRLAAFACVVLACVVAHAQEQQPQEKEIVREPLRLVVQIEYVKGAPFSYVSVPNWVWLGRFNLTPAASTRAPADTVRAVNVKTRMLDGRVEINVGVHVGLQQFDRLDEVATYQASAGETVVASDLERFGVEPLRMKVLNVKDTSVAPPTIVNKTQSIEAVVSKFEALPMPRVTVAVRNLSSKGVRAVELREVIDGRERIDSFIVNRDGGLLMGPGGTAEKKLLAATGHANQNDFTPTAIESVVISSAVFDDYTYEGDVLPAVRTRASDEGERLQLPRIISLLRDAGAARGPVTLETVKKFRERLAALDDTPPAQTLAAILNAYPELKPADREWAEGAMSASMHESKREMIDDLRKFETDFGRATAGSDFRALLKSHQERFERWLARL
ncbi:MAG TPA: hypothetical protein VGP08_24130 [Pyrinomonadaceae bacterium]|jgi:hypothetical protein|nr:hypothetical protein [Pyrinomonadaceae bacterium]